MIIIIIAAAKVNVEKADRAKAAIVMVRGGRDCGLGRDDDDGDNEDDDDFDDDNEDDDDDDDNDGDDDGDGDNGGSKAAIVMVGGK